MVLRITQIKGVSISSKLNDRPTDIMGTCKPSDTDHHTTTMPTNNNGNDTKVGRETNALAILRAFAPVQPISYSIRIFEHSDWLN